MRNKKIVLASLCVFGLLGVLGLLVGCTPGSESEVTGPPYKPVAGVKLLMVSVVEPQADILWDAVGWIISYEGTEEIRPENDEEWAAVRNAAVTIAESGNLLMMEGRATDDGDWMGWSRDLVDAAEEAMMAADARDEEAIFELGEKVYWVCTGCHETYWQEGVSRIANDNADTD